MAGRNEKQVIMVAGATGRQGGAVSRELLRRGFAVRALTRQPEQAAAAALREAGAEVVQGDLDDRASIERALAGAYGVFSVQNFWETGFDREVSQGVTLAEAARAAGVEHYVYSSVASAHRNTGLEHFESKWRIENRIRELGLSWTILRPVWFMENWERQQLRSAVLDGTISMPLSPGTNYQQVTVADVGAFAGRAFAHPERWLGRAVDLAGDERSISDVAHAFGGVIGRAVQYRQVPWDEYRKAAGDEYHAMFRWFQDVGYNADISVLREEYAELTDFPAYLRQHGWQDAARNRPAA